MRTLDLTPLSRSIIGFDRMFDMLGNPWPGEGETHYPPYNIEKLGPDAYRIQLAVAGFAPDELTVTAEHNSLTVTGRKVAPKDAEGTEEEGRYLHQGIANRAFERRFTLADVIKVTGASLENGLLSIDLVREVPEAMKPRVVPITVAAADGRKVIEHAAA